MKRNILILSTTVALMSSCGIYTKYERPEDVQTEDLYGANVGGEELPSLATLPWRELFKDPQLQALIEQGLASNVDLEKARLQVEQAQAGLRTARLAFLPSLALAPEGRVSSFDRSEAAFTYNAGAALSWELDFFGKLRNAKEQSKAALMMSEEYKQAVQTGIVSGIANIYYTLLMLDEQLIASQQSADFMKETARIMSALKDAGMQTEAGVAQARASAETMAISVLELNNAIQNTESAMCKLLCQVPQHIVRGKLSEQELQKDLSLGVPLDMISNRPDVRAAEYALAQSFYGVNHARSSFYPNLTLGGTAGWTNNVGAIVNPGKLLLTAMASLTQPLFSKGRLVANLKISKAQYEQSKLDFQQAVINAGNEVNTALIQCQTARKKAVHRKQQVDELERAVKNTRLLMEHGSTMYLEVLTAEQSYLQAKVSQASDWFDEAQGIVTLYKSLGGGTE